MRVLDTFALEGCTSCLSTATVYQALTAVVASRTTAEKQARMHLDHQLAATFAHSVTMLNMIPANTHNRCSTIPRLGDNPNGRQA